MRALIRQLFNFTGVFAKLASISFSLCLLWHNLTCNRIYTTQVNTFVFWLFGNWITKCRLAVGINSARLFVRLIYGKRRVLSSCSYDLHLSLKAGSGQAGKRFP